LDLPSHGLVAISGPSGSGKSTLLNCLSLLERPTEGEITYLGERIDSFSEREKEDYRNFECAFVYQHFNLLEEKTAFENVELPLLLRGEKEGNVALAASVLFKTFHLEHLMKKKARLLSGGEKQRVAILRALIVKPRVIFADEPTGALDGENEQLVMETLKKISRDNLVLLVSHNERIISSFAEREIVIEQGKLISDNPGKPLADPQRISHKRGGNQSWLYRLLGEDYRNDGLKNVLSFFACFLCFISLISTFGFYVGSHELIEKEKRATLGYLQASISKTVTYPIAGSPLKLSQSSRPEEEEALAALSLLKGVEVVPDFSYFFPSYLAFSFDETPHDPVAFAPVNDLSLANRSSSFLTEGETPMVSSLNEVLVNEEFAALFPDGVLNHVLHVAKNISVSSSEVSDEVSLSFAFEIKGIVKEFSFLNAPKVYYSYPALAFEMEEIRLDNLSKKEGRRISCASLVEEAEGHSPYSSYDYLVFAQDERSADALKEVANQWNQEGSSLSLSSSAFALEDAFLNLANAFSLSLLPFLVIGLIGVAFIIGSLAYSSFLERRKEAAILMALGARKGEIRKLFLFGSLLTVFSALMAALSLCFPLEKYGSLFLLNLLGIPELVRLPLGEYFGVPCFLILALSFFAGLISIFGAGLPLAKAEKNNLGEELKDE
jgi:putative ABC transport system ATP-binding protein